METISYKEKDLAKLSYHQKLKHIEKWTLSANLAAMDYFLDLYGLIMKNYSVKDITFSTNHHFRIQYEEPHKRAHFLFDSPLESEILALFAETMSLSVRRNVENYVIFFGQVSPSPKVVYAIFTEFSRLKTIKSFTLGFLDTDNIEGYTLSIISPLLQIY